MVCAQVYAGHRREFALNRKKTLAKERKTGMKGGVEVVLLEGVIMRGVLTNQIGCYATSHNTIPAIFGVHFDDVFWVPTQFGA